MLKITSPDYEDLTSDEQIFVPNNGFGKKTASYIRVTHKGETICLKSDAIEPEDATFCRDLFWIKNIILKAYELGKQDAP